MRGERFVVDLSDDEDAVAIQQKQNTPASQPDPATPASPFAFVKDIIEREPVAPKPPTLPTFKQTATGFPEHKKRTRISAFKAQRNQVPATEAFHEYASKLQPAQSYNAPSLRNENETPEEEELRQIDEENTKRLASMSLNEIEAERNELLESLSPSLAKLLMKRATKSSETEQEAKTTEKPQSKKDEDAVSYLKRATLDHGRGDTGIKDLGPIEHYKPSAEPVPLPKPKGKYTAPTKSVRWLEENEVDDDAEPPSEIKEHLQPASSFTPHKHDHEHAKCDDPTHDHSHDADGPAIHFPQGPAPPELDPSDPDFLEKMHDTYFPSLPADPSKLAWMAPLPTEGSPADLDSTYNPHQPALPASALRFDFHGALLPPNIARAMPVSKGLHHHADAPEAAGYTVPELARLARSTYPAQRCIAYQVLGRLMYRLGKGIFGQGSEMTMGLWRCIEEGKVLEILQQAAASETGHRSVRVYAQDAVWLWQRGGGKVMGAI